MIKFLEYAQTYLEEQLYIIDHEYLDFDLDLIEHPDWENVRDYVIVANPRFIEGLHDSPHYRATIASDLLAVRDILGR